MKRLKALRQLRQQQEKDEQQKSTRRLDYDDDYYAEDIDENLDYIGDELERLKEDDRTGVNFHDVSGKTIFLGDTTCPKGPHIL